MSWHETNQWLDAKAVAGTNWRIRGRMDGHNAGALKSTGENTTEPDMLGGVKIRAMSPDERLHDLRANHAVLPDRRQRLIPEVTLEGADLTGTDLDNYIMRAPSIELQLILAGQHQQVLKDQTIKCPCGLLRHVTKAFRCLYCGVWFCAGCAERHFGQTVQDWVIKKRVECRQQKELVHTIP